MTIKVPFMDLKRTHDECFDDIHSELRELSSQSKFIGGSVVSEFEREFADYCDVPYSVGVANGTAALKIALRAAEIGKGDEVILPTHTFIATAEAVVELGATPVLVDADSSSALMNLDQTRAAITNKTRAIMPVHLYGNPVDVENLDQLCREKNISLIHDSAQAQGAKWKGKGLGKFGDFQCFSFYPGKNLGAWGDAGAVTMHNEEHSEKVRALSNHGRMANQKYLHEVYGGMNDRIDALQSVVLRHKLRLLENQNENRRSLAQAFTNRLNGIGDIRFFEASPNATPVYHLFVIRTSQRDQLMTHLQENNIGCGIHYPIPVHLQPAFKDLGWKKGQFPVTEKICDEIVSLPFFPGMRDDEFERTVSVISSFYQ